MFVCPLLLFLVFPSSPFPYWFWLSCLDSDLSLDLVYAFRIPLWYLSPSDLGFEPLPVSGLRASQPPTFLLLLCWIWLSDFSLNLLNFDYGLWLVLSLGLTICIYFVHTHEWSEKLIFLFKHFFYIFTCIFYICTCVLSHIWEYVYIHSSKSSPKILSNKYASHWKWNFISKLG